MDKFKYDIVCRRFLLNKEFDNEVFEVLRSIGDIVLCKHFSKYRSYWKDMIQEATMRVCDLSFVNNYNPKYSAVNFIYTRMRNVMHNFLVTQVRVCYEYIPESDDFDYIFDIYDKESSDVNSSLLDVCNNSFKELSIFQGVSDKVLNLLDLHIKFLSGVDVKDDELDVFVLTKEEYESFKFYYNVYNLYIRLNFDDNLDFLNIYDIFSYYSIVKNKHYLNILLKFFSEKDIKKFFLLFAGMNFRFPSIENLIEYQVEYSIYKDYNKGFDYKNLQKKYRKSVFKIKYIVSKFLKFYKNG